MLSTELDRKIRCNILKLNVEYCITVAKLIAVVGRVGNREGKIFFKIKGNYNCIDWYLK